MAALPAFSHQNMIRATWVFTIHKQFDKIEFSQVNTNFWYDPSNAVSKAANVDVPDRSFIPTSPQPTMSTATSFLFFGDGLVPEREAGRASTLPPASPDLVLHNLGALNAAKSKYDKDPLYRITRMWGGRPGPTKSRPFNGGGKDITDARYDDASLPA